MKQTLKRLAQLSRLHRFTGVSGGHMVISRDEAEQLQLDNQWKNESLPDKQLEIVKKELSAIRASKVFPPHMQALIDQMKLTGITNPSVLEIGCSSGYYNEVLQLGGIATNYTGCDYSEAFIHLAKKLYPEIPFQVCDATKLPYNDKEFNVAISGCCILHILDYKSAIAETARVASEYVVMHRTPVVHLRETTYTRKSGYGIDMIEIIFNEQELLELFRENKLQVVDIRTFNQNPGVTELGEPYFTKNYLCKKVS